MRRIISAAGLTAAVAVAAMAVAVAYGYELGAEDSRQGMIFFSMSQHPAGAPYGNRDLNCLPCTCPAKALGAMRLELTACI